MARRNNVSINEMTTGQRIASYLELKAKKTAIESELKALEESIKATMESLQVNEVKENGFVARYEEGTQRRFDTTQFKADHADIYASYRKDVVTHSFKAYVEG